MTPSTFFVDREGGVRVPIFGSESEARERARELARAWRTRATLVEPVSGRAIVSYEAVDAGGVST